MSAALRVLQPVRPLRPEFFRIVICRSTIEVLTYKFGRLTNKIMYSFQQVQEVIKSCATLRYPIELVISHRSMACRSLSSEKLTQKDIQLLVKNSLASQTLNTVFYQGRKNNFSMCECELPKDFADVLSKILKLNVMSINVFPFWLVSKFINCINDTAVFIVTFIKYWNIIIVNKNKILYNRTGNLENFDKDLELKNTLVHLKTVHNINLRDVIIYELGDQTVESLTRYSTTSKMKIVSNVGRFRVRQRSNIIHLGYFALFIILANATKTCFSIYETQENIDVARKELEKIDFANDLEIYERLRDVLFEPDYKAAIREFLQGKTVNSIDMILKGKKIECFANQKILKNT